MKSQYGIFKVKPNWKGGEKVKPLIRNGKHVTFKKKKDGEKWLEDNPPYSKIVGMKFEVRKLYKNKDNLIK